MGIDYSAGYADVIEWDQVAQLVPQEAAEFMAVVDKHKSVEDAQHVLAGLARCYQFDPPETDELRTAINCETDAEEDTAMAELQAAYASLRAAFAGATSIAKTTSQLELGIGYHDSQSQGCRGDELDGVYWYVDGAQELSPAGRQFEKLFLRKFFTSWG
ncbi:MAG: hypothetical protein WD060_11555 [Pirellulales bacterium]